MCILETRGMKSNIADTEHVFSYFKRKKTIWLLPLVKLMTLIKNVLEQATLQPDINSGMISEDDDDEKKCLLPVPVGSNSSKNANRHKQLQKRPTPPVLDNFRTDDKAAEEGRLDPVVGREKKLNAWLKFCRRKKNNRF